jgi:hypothetical protein
MTSQLMVLRPKGWTPGTIPPVEPRESRPIQILQVKGGPWDELQQGTQSVFDYLLATLRRTW